MKNNKTKSTPSKSWSVTGVRVESIQYHLQDEKQPGKCLICEADCDSRVMVSIRRQNWSTYMPTGYICHECATSDDRVKQKANNAKEMMRLLIASKRTDESSRYIIASDFADAEIKGLSDKDVEELAWESLIQDV